MTSPRPVPLGALLLLPLLLAAAGCGTPRPTEATSIARGTALPPPGLAMPPAGR